MSNVSNQALSVFVVCQIVNISSLLADYLLMKINLPTITEIAVKYPICGSLILMFECIFPISLGLHILYAPRQNL